MVGFEWSGLCICRLLFMGLRPLCLLLTACESFGLPSKGLCRLLSLLDGPTGCGPAFCVVWFRFRLLRRYLALWPAEVRRVHRLLEMVGEGCPGHGPIHLLSHVRERDKALLRRIRVEGVWNGFLLGRVRFQVLLCRFCGAPDGDGHSYWECTFPPLVEIRENPEFHDLMRMDKEHWHRCLLWHGWLPM